MNKNKIRKLLSEQMVPASSGAGSAADSLQEVAKVLSTTVMDLFLEATEYLGETDKDNSSAVINAHRNAEKLLNDSSGLVVQAKRKCKEAADACKTLMRTILR